MGVAAGPDDERKRRDGGFGLDRCTLRDFGAASPGPSRLMYALAQRPTVSAVTISHQERSGQKTGAKYCRDGHCDPDHGAPTRATHTLGHGKARGTGAHRRRRRGKLDMKRLDVRSDLEEGREPFETIMAFQAGLGASEAWELLATFRPDPLINLMGGRGYETEAVEWPDGTWLVTFRPQSEAG